VLLDRKSIPLIEIDIKIKWITGLEKRKKMLLEQKFYISHWIFSAKRSETKKVIE